MDRNTLADAADFLGRLLLASLFLWDGWSVVQNYTATGDYLAQFGVPALLLPLALALQVGGGILIVIGWWTRAAALALALFCISTAVIFHGQSGDLNETIHFWKDLALAGGFLVLAANGARGFALGRSSPGPVGAGPR